MDKKKITGEVLARVGELGDKKFLNCRDAFAIAAKNDVSPGVIGQICNSEEIKVKNCQLGCF